VSESPQLTALRHTIRGFPTVLVGYSGGVDSALLAVVARQELGRERMLAAIGRSAGEKAVRRLNPRKVKSQNVPVVFDPRESGGLVGHLAGAISGSSVARGTSFLKDRMGTAIFAPHVDAPFLQMVNHRRRGM
jgi:predicted Zn-dependent protease